MQSAIINIINRFGYLGIVALIAIENIFPPIPSEVILTFGGFATTISNITVTGAIITATIGSVLGAIVLYWAGRVLNEERIYRFTESKAGRLLCLKKENIHKAFRWFNGKGQYAVFFGRFIPIVRSLVSIPAGMAKMPMVPFLILTTIGSIIWNTVLIVLGRIAGESWNIIAKVVGGYSDIVLIGFIALFILGFAMFFFKRKGKIKIIRIKKNKYKKNLE